MSAVALAGVSPSAPISGMLAGSGCCVGVRAEFMIVEQLEAGREGFSSTIESSSDEFEDLSSIATKCSSKLVSISLIDRSWKFKISKTLG